MSLLDQAGISETTKVDNTTLPLILVGPILRRATADELVIWLVCADPVPLRLCCYWDGERRLDMEFPPDHAGHLRIGVNAHLHLFRLRPPEPLPVDRWIEYDIAFLSDNGDIWLSDELPHLTYPGETRMRFVIKTRIDELLFGSCRKPHHDSGDGLVLVDDLLVQVRGTAADPTTQPALLLMTGDQVYLDDVAGPMLAAIHQVIERLGLPSEGLSGAAAGDSATLYRHPDSYFRRERLLPDTKSNSKLRERFFGGVRKPIFTTDSAHNHLITLAEVLAMYLLVWSPQLWRPVDLSRPALVDEEFSPQYERELGIVEAFAEGLPQIQRVLAAVPTYMIFDDHDVTDDWNLTRGWEESAYGHPFSRRIIGNALIGYLLCQGWGTAPRRIPEALTISLQQFFRDPGDVHYSFVYDVEVRHYQGGPAIWQITCSGVKNEFPPRLLRLFDRLNRWLFASQSPLNWLTRRRAFRIRQRRPSQHRGRYRHQRLANGSGIGRLRLDDEGSPISIEMLWANGERLRFSEGRTTDWVH